MDIRPLNFTLDPGACSEIRCCHHFRQGRFKISADFHIWIDVKFRVLIYFWKLWAWQVAHWISPSASELARKFDADNICTKGTQDFNRFPLWIDVALLVLMDFNEMLAWKLVQVISPWACEFGLELDDDTTCVKKILGTTLHKRNQPWATCIHHVPQAQFNQQPNGAFARGQGKPSSIWSDWGEFCPDLTQGFVSHVIWNELKQGSSPIEFQPGPRSLLWNPMLSAFAPRELQMLIDFHMWVDVALLILVKFNEIWAWKLARWISPSTSELAVKSSVASTCAKMNQDANRCP